MKRKQIDNNRKKRPFVPPPTLGVCELVDEKGARFFELTKNGGHYLMLPPELLRKVVRATFSKMKEKGEKPMLLLTAPDEGLLGLFNTNIQIIREEFQKFFASESIVFVKEHKDMYIFKDGEGREIKEGEVVAKLHEASTYFGVLLTGNPSLEVNPSESQGAELFHIVNNILAPKQKEAELFREEEGVIKIAMLESMDKKELVQLAYQLSEKTTEMAPGLKLLVAKILDDCTAHAGGRYVLFCPFTSDEKYTKKRVRAFAKALAKYKKAAFYKFLNPIEVYIERQRYIAHARYVANGDGESVLLFKLVSASPITLKSDIMSIKQAFNTGRKGDALVVHSKRNGEKDLALVTAEEGKVISAPEDITIVFGGERKSSPTKLLDTIDQIAESLSRAREAILRRVFEGIKHNEG